MTIEVSPSDNSAFAQFIRKHPFAGNLLGYGSFIAYFTVAQYGAMDIGCAIAGVPAIQFEGVFLLSLLVSFIVIHKLRKWTGLPGEPANKVERTQVALQRWMLGVSLYAFTQPATVGANLLGFVAAAAIGFVARKAIFETMLVALGAFAVTYMEIAGTLACLTSKEWWLSSTPGPISKEYDETLTEFLPESAFTG